MANDHDALFRHVFAQPEHAASLLRAALPAAVVAAIDWPSLRLAAGTSVDDLAATPEAELAGREASVLHRLALLLLQFVPAIEPPDPEAVVDRWRDLFRAVWNHPNGRAAVYSLFSYLASRLDVAAERFVAAGARIHEGARQVGKSLADRLHEQGFQAGIARGEAQGEARGEARGKAEALLTILRARFGEVPAALAARARSLSSDGLDALLARAATAPSLVAVFA